MSTTRKTCKGCGKTRLRKMFYSQPGSSDGLAGKCKECVKAAVKANRQKRIDYYREYDRKRANKPDRVKARAEYVKTLKGKMSAIRGKKAYIERNPVKRAAHTAVSNALRDGKLIKGPCEVCGTTKNVQGHHDDYSRPLNVRWLCVTHHAEHHKNEREQKREKAA